MPLHLLRMCPLNPVWFSSSWACKKRTSVRFFCCDVGVLWLAVRVLSTCAHWPTLPVHLGGLLPSAGVGINLKDSQPLQGSRGKKIPLPGLRVWRGPAMSTSPRGPLVSGGTPHKSGTSGPPGKAPRRLTSRPLAPPASRPREDTPAFSPWSCSDSQPSSSWMPDSRKEGMK